MGHDLGNIKHRIIERGERELGGQVAPEDAPADFLEVAVIGLCAIAEGHDLARGCIGLRTRAQSQDVALAFWLLLRDRPRRRCADWMTIEPDAGTGLAVRLPRRRRRRQ